MAAAAAAAAHRQLVFADVAVAHVERALEPVLRAARHAASGGGGGGGVLTRRAQLTTQAARLDAALRRLTAAGRPRHERALVFGGRA